MPVQEIQDTIVVPMTLFTPHLAETTGTVDRPLLEGCDEWGFGALIQNALEMAGQIGTESC